jgi:hypothetical protein
MAASSAATRRALAEGGGAPRGNGAWFEVRGGIASAQSSADPVRRRRRAQAFNPEGHVLVVSNGAAPRAFVHTAGDYGCQPAGAQTGFAAFRLASVTMQRDRSGPVNTTRLPSRNA